MIVSHFATTLKATNKALSHAEGRVKAVESELKGSAKIVQAFTERLQIAVAKTMQLEGTFDMRGLIETVEQKYREKYDADPNMKSVKGIGREALWRVILANEHFLASCLKRNRGFDAVQGPGRMASIYTRLSGFIHKDIKVYQVSH
ncbi:hypothetical protein WJX75_008725 [Coccomyxa subellipsoidea]|uniref:Uncharacterized protein n=1 Tax=Coccomyxa subellipsoidea TaxID=248742 RepID=A0ABR2YJV7_9CHLO